MKLLIIDDEKGIRDSLKTIFSKEKFNILEADDGIRGEQLIFEEKPEIIILDIRMPGKSGIDILKKINEKQLLSEVIIITGYGDVDLAVQSTKLGAFDFIEKPFSPDRIKLTVRNAVEKYNLKKTSFSHIEEEIKKYKIIGNSRKIKKVKELIERVAKTDSTVLILGESGTGKELVARNIHYFSNRRFNQFIYLNCAAIPEELVESELFGHKKGSFTGAIENKIGKFEKADGGSIFLDEIGDLSLRAQAKVLRVIENGEVQRIGENIVKHVDVRIIAATNKILEKEISEGSFRQDLYYRLNVVLIDIPPLRERKEDIPLLLDYFSDILSLKYGIEKKQFDDKLLEYLSDKSWKGNVRELRNFVERVYAFINKQKIKIEDILPYWSDDTILTPSPIKFKRFKDFMIEAERRFIENKLKLYNWNVALTSREIGMSRVNLIKKINNLKIKNSGAEERSPQKNSEEESPNSTGQGAL